MRPQIPTLKEIQPLLEIDRDERKLDVFLTVHRGDLLVSDLKIFLPFTINLDPYIKKKIKEEQQTLEEDNHFGIYKNPWQKTAIDPWVSNRTNLTNRHAKLTKAPSLQGSSYPPPPPMWPMAPMPPMAYDWSQTPWMSIPPVELISKALSATTTLPAEILEIKLSSLSVDSICDLLSKIDELNPNNLESYKSLVRENNITGKVLLLCDLMELKQVNN